MESVLNKLALLESLLFVASGPVSPSRLGKVLEVNSAEIETLLRQLEAHYQGRGMAVQWSEQGVQLTTAPLASAAVEQFLGLELTTRLSQAALEVLAIIAYRQPITRPQVDQIRGVNSDGALRKLLSHGVVEEVGRHESAGRPILYGTTTNFLQQFGLSTLAELPALDEETELLENEKK